MGPAAVGSVDPTPISTHSFPCVQCEGDTFFSDEKIIDGIHRGALHVLCMGCAMKRDDIDNIQVSDETRERLVSLGLIGEEVTKEHLVRLVRLMLDAKQNPA